MVPAQALPGVATNHQLPGALLFLPVSGLTLQSRFKGLGPRVVFPVGDENGRRRCRSCVSGRIVSLAAGGEVPSRDAAQNRSRGGLQVAATHSQWAATSTTSSPSDANTTPYVVKDGDTLTSIAKKSKISVRTLADANSIADLDFLLSGQLLHVPTEVESYERPSSQILDDDEFPIPRGYAQRRDIPDVTEARALPSRWVSGKVEGSQMAASVRPAPAFNFPRLAVAVLLIAPLLGFCIRCIVDALYIHVYGDELKQQAETESWEALHRPKAQRWQKILEEDRDGVEATSPSSEGSAGRNPWAGGDVWSQDPNLRESTRENSKSETDEEIGLRHKQDYEDIRNSYAELESSYVKFLADSGMSKSGYWRGSGLPTSARLDDGEPR